MNKLQDLLRQIPDALKEMESTNPLKAPSKDKPENDGDDPDECTQARHKVVILILNSKAPESKDNHDDPEAMAS